ncbi:hypothetical protein ADUPG1_007263, partial [Aduncisulcus paluster]
CYTVHDDEIRAYLSESTNGCLTVGAAESNGIISVATLRSSLTCSSLDLSDIVSYSSNISDVTELTTLQGLEYATSLTSLTLDGYDLSGDSNSNAEYDQLVVQILAKAVDYTVTEGTVDSGLTSLSVSGCGLTEVSDILDLTPIVSEDAATQPFKLTTLDISDNAISDVSVLITEDIFPADTLTTLDISGNNICDIDGMVSELQAKFTALSSVTYSDQTCHCSASVSSADHQVCREVYPGRWAVECWHGYYLDKASGSCVAACASGYVYDTASATCVSSSSAVDDAIRCQVCEGHSTMMPVLEEGNSSITCGCRTGWYGDDCDSYEFQLYIPDDNFRTSVCEAADYAEGTVCDISEFEMATLGSYSAYACSFSSLVGLEYLINVEYIMFNLSEISVDESLSSLIQLVSFTNDSYDPYIENINSLLKLNRLQSLSFYGDIFDISVLFRNISMVGNMIANTADSISGIPLCRSESDDDYMSFISSIFPIHNTTTTYKDKYYLPNICPLNDDPGNTPYYCDPDTYDQCPSIVLNEVYNSLDGVDSKECAFIAKEGDNGECYTVHDDEIRAYLSDADNGFLTSDDIESNGIINVATLRSSLTSVILKLSDIVTYSSNISDVNEITTLQGLEYATSLIYLNIDGYDLSEDTNSNAEYDKLVVQILAKAVSRTNDYGSIDSGLL